MKFKLFISTLAIFYAANVLAGNPNSEKSKPTKEIKYWCEVKGTYTRTTMGDGGTLEQCKVEYPPRHCYYIPCTSDKDYVFTTSSIPVPAGVVIQEGQPFFARYENGVYNVVYLNVLDISVQTDPSGVDIVVISH